jgi:hypothetical protein
VINTGEGTDCKKSQKFIESMSDNFIDIKTKHNENALEVSRQESYRVIEVVKTNFTAEILSGSCVEHLVLWLFGENTVTNIVKTSLPMFNVSIPFNAILRRYIETLIRERHNMIRIAFS